MSTGTSAVVSYLGLTFIWDCGLFPVLSLWQGMVEDTSCVNRVRAAAATPAWTHIARCQQFHQLRSAPLWIKTSLFLLKDPRGHHSHRQQHNLVNSHSQELLQHPQNDLASLQQVRPTDWGRKRGISQCQTLRFRIKCLKNSELVYQLHWMCLFVLI